MIGLPAPSTLAIHPLHAPNERVVIAELGVWELRQFAPGDRKLAYFAAKGFAHVQLWHPTQHVSVITPSRLTNGEFELWIAGERYNARTWATIEVELAVRGIKPPGRHAMRSIERWFVLPVETRAGRLLRSWWAGAEETAR
jgi:hypothetical protein